MQIDLITLLEKEEASAVIREELPGFSIDDYLVSDPIQVDGELSLSNQLISLSLRIAFQSISECSRCLNPVKRQESIATSERYSIQEAADLFGDVIDTTPFVLEAVTLNRPTKVLCQPDCKGLCPTCGTNRNEKECNCYHEAINPKFAALQSLLDNGGNNEEV